MRRCRVVFVIIMVALAPGTSAFAAAKLGPEHVVALERWMAAVDQHTPGRTDEPLAAVSALTYDQRQELSDALEVFFSALAGRMPGTQNAAEERIGRIGLDTSRAPGANPFLERAALLHGDAVIFASNLPAPPFDARDAHSGEAQLLSAADGEFQGLVRPSWHSRFARDLLDHVQPRPAADPFVGRWYHAMAAYLMAFGRYGEAAAPLRRAAELLPDDPAILFDRACLAEATGLPRSQQVLADPRAQTDASSGPGSVPGRSGLPSGQRTERTNPLAENAANAEAERLFRRVLALDPARADARLRLGRLLIVRRRYAEAETELGRAIATARDATTSYLGHLFAARASARLGRFDAAATHVGAALALFPDAQSALIAASQLALQRADVARAIAPVDRLARIDHARQPIDPWLAYDAGPGRDASTLLAALWASVNR
jgi:tetratricopeptide (TPR) repeat protein